MNYGMTLLSTCASVWVTLGCVMVPGGCSSTEDCRASCPIYGPNDPPATDCLVHDGKLRCVCECSVDADCDQRFYSGCTDRADDGTRICHLVPHTEWRLDCQSADLAVPANEAKAIDGTPTCVYVCGSGVECPSEYFSGCTARSDDGTMICEPRADSEESDAGVEAGG
jgi:hypothetical protein